MPLSFREMTGQLTRRSLLAGGAGLAACNKKPKGNPYAGRWEGKLTNDLSSVMLQADFLERAPNELELRFTARDFFFAAQPIQTWSIEGNAFSLTLPFVEGERAFKGFFSGPTFDVVSEASGEKLHVRQLGRVPALPYKEAGPESLTPSIRAVRAKAKLLGPRATLRRFHADLLARLGIASQTEDTAGAGWLFVEDQEIPKPKADLPFAIFVSPAYEQIRAIAAYSCPLFVLLGESDERFVKLPRGTRQVAYDLREALTKQGRTMDTFQISVAPKADQLLRVKGFGKEYPRLVPNYLDYFKRFFGRFGVEG
ncbi:MAG: hypothetical protein NW208_01965 [Bryobacter sp.]|nr:hypothetical protein [Bryobacter sp.]